jgi:DNA-binding response OmpR family regulator
MISALDEIETVVRCIEMGAEDYLPKPFDPVLLKARVDACLEKKRLRDQELDYLRNVAAITGAVGSLESGAFDPESLHEVAERTDALGKLAKMFQHMAQEVQAREQRLRQEVQALRVEIDEAKKAKQVAEVTESGYFQDLQQKVLELRKRKGR